MPRVLVDSLNLCRAAWGRLQRVLATHYPDLLPLYRTLRRDRWPYHRTLLERTRKIAARHGLTVEE